MSLEFGAQEADMPNDLPTRHIGLNCDLDKSYFKITNSKEMHNGFQYVDGLNVLKEKFNINGSCVSGGLYFSDVENIHDFFTYGMYLRDVIIPKDDPELQMVQDPSGGKWRANRIILGNKYSLDKFETYEYLLSRGAKFHNLYYAMLNVAVMEPDFKLVKYLKTKGVSIYDVHNSMCRIALRENNLELAKSLVAEGCPVYLANQTIALCAAKQGEWDLVCSLIKEGRITYVKKLGKYILKNGDFELITLLMDGGIMNVENKKNFLNCALKTAIEQNSMDLLKLCTKHVLYSKKIANRALCEAAAKGNLVMTKYFVENGANFRADSECPLRNATEFGHFDVVKYLVELGSDIHVSGSDPLFNAIRCGSLPMVKFLHKKGAKIRISIDEPLLIAVHYEKLEIVQYLLENGANPTSQNNIIIKYASDKGLKDISECLEKATRK